MSHFEENESNNSYATRHFLFAIDFQFVGQKILVEKNYILEIIPAHVLNLKNTSYKKGFKILIILTT